MIALFRYQSKNKRIFIINKTTYKRTKIKLSNIQNALFTFYRLFKIFPVSISTG
ncbi:protein of unknown function [Chryseobacterium sp. JV274]|nr:protein of unknown function [Chryseobacterium sp. JV274]